MAKLFDLSSISVEKGLGPNYRWTYKNRSGGKIRVYKSIISLFIEKSWKHVRLEEIVKIDNNKEWVHDPNEGEITFHMKSETYTMKIDTVRGQFHDLPDVVRALQRRQYSFNR